MHALDLHKIDAHTAPIVPNPGANRLVAKEWFTIMYKLDNYHVHATYAIFTQCVEELCTTIHNHATRYW